VHAVVATAANTADSKVLPQGLQGEETWVWGDQANRGQREVIHAVAPRAQDFTNQCYRYKGRLDEVEGGRTG
jgi:IS5 family transposase